MTGRQQRIAWRGNRNELLASYILSSISAVTRVGRPDDYGLDLLCTLIRQERDAVLAGRAFGVQVKPQGQRSVKYGGLNRKREWKGYEIEWLYSQDQPLLVAVPDPTETLLKLYSTFRIWYLVMQRSKKLGQVELVPDEELSKTPTTISSGQWRYDESLVKPAGEVGIHGDGISYRIPLGKPIVCISGRDSDHRVDELRQVLEVWLNLEYANIALIQNGVPYVYECTEWETNQRPSKIDTYQAWNATPGQNIGKLLVFVAPAIASLMHNLIAQNLYADASKLAPIAEWLEVNGLLDDLGRNNLAAIKAKMPIAIPSKSSGEHAG